MQLGTGIYTPKEAAMLLHTDSGTVRRWAFGYTRSRASGSVTYAPLINTELPEIEGERALTFVELIELLYVRAFRKAGLQWAAMKEAANVAARIYCSEHPFALRKLYVDPSSLYGAAEEADGSESLVQLVGHGQHAFPDLVKPYLDQIDFGADDIASRWWPMGRTAGVVIDPDHAFGAPIIDGVGIRTATLSGAYKAEKARYRDRTMEHVAWVYDVSPRDVEVALKFKRWLMPKKRIVA